ncbi:RND family efflux transporter, MFP subunit [Malonomonas rubra DSM 5091]|uniref:RND family efflux transporter, MFP subunit n=1 Tax=Malonomonas rubra DSM 5091 TaxID=1122189 RepID=A0A1M6HE13_MALRU|nr:efflux RND transporter periplasmic adaptor subunit [Malonomonas rubra]SHJ20468.1 RND family efflux transporter, MFP subunit [Malonomonas rubra DSM 5091]
MRSYKIIILALLFSLLPLLLLAADRLPLGNSSFQQSYPGTIFAGQQAKLAFRVGGPLVKVAVKPGDKVIKGQLLMQIDPRDFEDAIRVLEAQLAGAESLRDRAQRDFDRAQTLFEQHVSATADFDRAKSAFDSAFAGVQSLKAQLQIARHKLRDTSLKAPFSGTITTQSAENFEMISAGKQVLEIKDTSTLEVEIKVPENEVGRRQVKPNGQTATVRFPAIPNRSVTAKLIEWNVSADPLTRTYALRFSFPMPEDFYVLPGMTAEVRIDNGQ